MTSVGNVERLVAVLQARLVERSRERGRAAQSRRASATKDVHVIRELASSASDDQLKRALIQNLLADHFGRDLMNEARFQQVVGAVKDALQADEGGARLLDRVVADLRAAAAP